MQYQNNGSDDPANSPNDANEISSTIKSVGIAYKILEIVARNEGPLSLKIISRRANVSPSKAHRYAQTLCNCGLLNQEHKSANYDLGMNALRIGLAAISRVNIVNRAGEGLSDLAEAINADVFISVWSDLGPTVVRFQRSSQPLVSMVGPGTALPLLTSATGMVFLAYASPHQTDHVLEKEASKNPDLMDVPLKQVAAKFAHVREAGYAFTAGVLFGERHCAAAPILSINDKILAAVTFVSSNRRSVEPDSDEVTKLKEFCQFHSLPQTGYYMNTRMEDALAN